MQDLPSDETSPTLLWRVGQGSQDQEAWEIFVACYGPKIRNWCRQRGLQAADAEDVTQDVLLRLARALKTFSLRSIPDVPRLAAIGDPARTERFLRRSSSSRRR